MLNEFSCLCNYREQDASTFPACTNLFSRWLRVGTEPELPRRFVGPFRFLPASPSFIPRAHSGIHSRRVLLATTRKISGTAISAGRARARYRALRASVKAQNLWRSTKCPAEENPLGRVSRPRARDSFTAAGAKFLYAPPPGRHRRVCVNLHWHAWNYVAIVRATTRFPVSSCDIRIKRRHYVASKMENISRAADAAGRFLRSSNIARAKCFNVLRCLRAINASCFFCKSFAILGHRLLSWLKCSK